MLDYAQELFYIPEFEDVELIDRLQALFPDYEVLGYQFFFEWTCLGSKDYQVLIQNQADGMQVNMISLNEQEPDRMTGINSSNFTPASFNNPKKPWAWRSIRDYETVMAIAEANWIRLIPAKVI